MYSCPNRGRPGPHSSEFNAGTNHLRNYSASWLGFSSAFTCILFGSNFGPAPSGNEQSNGRLSRKKSEGGIKGAAHKRDDLSTGIVKNSLTYNLIGNQCFMRIGIPLPQKYFVSQLVLPTIITA